MNSCHLNLSRLGWCPCYLISTVLSKKHTVSSVRCISSTGVESFLCLLSAGFIRIDPFIPKWTLEDESKKDKEKKGKLHLKTARLDSFYTRHSITGSWSCGWKLYPWKRIVQGVIALHNKAHYFIYIDMNLSVQWWLFKITFSFKKK